MVKAISGVFEMDYILEVQDVMQHLSEEKQKIIFDVARNFLSEGFDYLSEEDLADIEIAREEYKNGLTISHSEVFKEVL